MNDLTLYAREDYPVVADSTMVADMIVEAAGPNGFGVNDLDRVKVPSGGGQTWELPTPDGVKPVKHIDCVIVDVRPTRARFNPTDTNAKAPLCASTDGITGHGDPGGECRNCYFNKFETAVNEHGEPLRGKACKEGRRITFFVPDEYLPKTLLLPPTSIARIDGGGAADITTYNRRLLSGGKPYYRVVTRISLVVEKEPKPHSLVVFSRVTDIPREEWPHWDEIKKAVARSIRVDVGVVGDESSAGASHANSA